ncbi:MAG: transposase [Pseudomonadales bacterium]
MPRRARLCLPGVPHHIIQRGNNRQACFPLEQDYRWYLRWLDEYAETYECDIHAYVLMTNHVHLLITPPDKEALSMMMRCLSQRFSQHINKTYERTGTLWDSRFKSCIAGEERYILACYRYIEMNPVRAGMVEHPAEYPWSSYRSNAELVFDALVSPQATYNLLGKTRETRADAYKQLFYSPKVDGTIDDIRTATRGNYALGSAAFKRQVEKTLGQPVSKRKPGRQTKTA